MLNVNNNKDFVIFLLHDILAILLILLVPSIIRFFIFDRGIKYGLEIYFYTMVSMIISSLLIYGIEQYMPVLSFLNIFSIYFILSYESYGENTMTKFSRIMFSILTIFILAIWVSAANVINQLPRRGANIWALFAAFEYILWERKEKE